MTHAEWIAIRERLVADLTACRRGANDQPTLDKINERCRALRASVDRYYVLSARGFVSVTSAFWSRPPVTRVTIRDESRFQERTMTLDDDLTRLSAAEIAEAFRVRDLLNQWIAGTLAEMPAGVTLEEAYAPWRKR